MMDFAQKYFIHVHTVVERNKHLRIFTIIYRYGVFGINWVSTFERIKADLMSKKLSTKVRKHFSKNFCLFALLW